jgi:opacity protein-like surface antigen
MTTKTNFYRNLLASVAFSVLALTVNAEGGVTTGWKPYVGGGLGYSVLDVKNNHYEKESLANRPTTSASSATAKGAVESLFLGVQKQINSMALGAELYGYLSQQTGKMDANTIGETRHQTIRRQYGYGLKLKTGYFVNPTALAYVHAGLESARFKYAGNINLNPDQNFKRSKSLVGVPLGAGLEVDISSAWKTRLEYTYTRYKTWNTGNVLMYGDTATSKLSPSQHTVVLGFSYQI